MWRLIARRIIWFFPTLLLVSLLAFGLSRLAPGDPVVELCGEEVLQNREAYQQCMEEYELDLPAFYCSLQPAAFPDSLHRVYPAYARKAQRELLVSFGNWNEVEAYFKQVELVGNAFQEVPDSLGPEVLIKCRQICADLQAEGRYATIQYQTSQLDSLLGQLNRAPQAAVTPLAGLLRQVERLPETASRSRLFLPAFTWYGKDCQFHQWWRRIFRGEWGISYVDRRPVGDKIREGVFWTLLLNTLSFLLALAIAIPLGVYAAVHQGGRFDRFSSLIVFMLYSLPRFWIATIVVVFFTSSVYGSWLDWFPSIGLGDQDHLGAQLPHLIAPVLCQTYGLLAFFSRQMRGSMLDAIRQDYIRTVRAHGLPEQKVIWKYAFRNALFPIITILASLIPAAIAGSVVIEVIFAIPGMGLITYDAIFANDWPVVFGVLFLSALLTMIGILLADLLYYWADPRVSFESPR
jgi:peptide/nickel transport system permease protein